jgi:hypothetical protein
MSNIEHACTRGELSIKSNYTNGNTPEGLRANFTPQGSAHISYAVNLVRSRVCSGLIPITVNRISILVALACHLALPWC